jgi:hypothetical protein
MPSRSARSLAVLRHDTLREHRLFDRRDWTVNPAFATWVREKEEP